jgi:protein TonB
MPSFPGGESAMMRYLSEHARYPASAREVGHHGTVVVQFDVQRDGSLRHITAAGTPDSALAAEAVRVVTGMPHWNPGRYDGRTVVVQYSLPIRFVLQ